MQSYKSFFPPKKDTNQHCVLSVQPCGLCARCFMPRTLRSCGGLRVSVSSLIHSYSRAFPTLSPTHSLLYTCTHTHAFKKHIYTLTHTHTHTHTHTLSHTHTYTQLHATRHASLHATSQRHSRRISRTCGGLAAGPCCGCHAGADGR